MGCLSAGKNPFISMLAPYTSQCTQTTYICKCANTHLRKHTSVHILKYMCTHIYNTSIHIHKFRISWFLSQHFIFGVTCFTQYIEITFTPPTTHTFLIYSDPFFLSNQPHNFSSCPVFRFFFSLWSTNAVSIRFCVFMIETYMAYPETFDPLYFSPSFSFHSSPPHSPVVFSGLQQSHVDVPLRANNSAVI